MNARVASLTHFFLARVCVTYRSAPYCQSCWYCCCYCNFFWCYIYNHYTTQDPLSTNLHLHGVHISGTAPADDFSTVVKPGETGIYTYAIPCDHIGGTYWYHANHHGSLALQVRKDDAFAFTCCGTGIIRTVS
jgi:Multicopper oxidase